MKKIAIVLMGMLVMWAGSFAWQVQARATQAVSSLTAGNISLVGRVGAQAQAVAVAGNYAYLGMGPELIVLSISNPMTPTQVGSILLPNTVQDVAVMGSLAYVVEGTSGLQVIDVSNPAHPAVIGALLVPGAAQRIVMAGNTAYIAAGAGGLRIVNVSNPANPIEVGYYNSGWDISRVAVNGNYAYVIEGYGRLTTLNVANPSAPVQTNLSEAERWTDLAVANGSLYVGYYSCEYIRLPCSKGGLQTFRLTNPAVPVTSTDYLASGPVMVVDVSGSHAYLGIGGATLPVIASPALEIVNTTSMTQESTRSMAGVIHQFRLANNRLYSASGNRGLRVLDVSNSANPIELGTYEQGIALNSLDTVAASGDFAYTTGPHGLQVFNVSSPISPTASGSYVFARTVGWGNTGAAVANDYVYFADNYPGSYLETRVSLDILHLSNPNAPSWEGGVLLKTTGLGGPPSDKITFVTVVGQYAYVSDGYSFWRINVITPTAPTIASVYNIWEANLPSPYMHIDDGVVTGTWAYLAESVSDPLIAQIDVLDVSVPVTPTKVSSYTLTSPVTQLAVQDHYLFAVDGYGLLVLDIADPGHIVEIGRCALSGTINDLVVAGNYAYLAMLDGVRVIDISNPTYPNQVAAYSMAYGATTVAVKGNYLYVTSGEDGLFVMQLSGAVAGQITTSAYEPMTGVTVTLNSSLNVTTTTDGLYAFTSLPAGSYSVTPTLPGYVFWPPSRTLNVPSPAATAANFVLLPPPVSTNLDPGTAITLSYTDTHGLRTDLFFPSGAVSQTTALTVTPVMIDDRLPNQAFTGHAFDMVAQPDQVFNVPVTVTIRYSDSDIRVISDENSLALLWWDGSSWAGAVTTCAPSSSSQRDVLINTISLPICRTGRYALFGPTHPIYLPLVFR